LFLQRQLLPLLPLLLAMVVPPICRPVAVDCAGLVFAQRTACNQCHLADRSQPCRPQRRSLMVMMTATLVGRNASTPAPHNARQATSSMIAVTSARVLCLAACTVLPTSAQVRALILPPVLLPHLMPPATASSALAALISPGRARAHARLLWWSHWTLLMRRRRLFAT